MLLLALPLHVATLSAVPSQVLLQAHHPSAPRSTLKTLCIVSALVDVMAATRDPRVHHLVLQALLRTGGTRSSRGWCARLDLHSAMTGDPSEAGVPWAQLIASLQRCTAVLGPDSPHKALVLEVVAAMGTPLVGPLAACPASVPWVGHLITEALGLGMDSPACAGLTLLRMVVRHQTGPGVVPTCSAVMGVVAREGLARVEPALKAIKGILVVCAKRSGILGTPMEQVAWSLTPRNALSVGAAMLSSPYAHEVYQQPSHRALHMIVGLVQEALASPDYQASTKYGWRHPAVSCIKLLLARSEVAPDVGTLLETQLLRAVVAARNSRAERRSQYYDQLLYWLGEEETGLRRMDSEGLLSSVEVVLRGTRTPASLGVLHDVARSVLNLVVHRNSKWHPVVGVAVDFVAACPAARLSLADALQLLLWLDRKGAGGDVLGDVGVTLRTVLHSFVQGAVITMDDHEAVLQALVQIVQHVDEPPWFRLWAPVQQVVGAVASAAVQEVLLHRLAPRLSRAQLPQLTTLLRDNARVVPWAAPLLPALQPLSAAWDRWSYAREAWCSSVARSSLLRPPVPIPWWMARSPTSMPE